mgnify:CR=1 FL=1
MAGFNIFETMKNRGATINKGAGLDGDSVSPKIAAKDLKELPKATRREFLFSDEDDINAFLKSKGMNPAEFNTSNFE